MANLIELLQLRSGFLHDAAKLSESDPDRAELLALADRANGTIRSLGRRDLSFSKDKPLPELLAELDRTDDSGIRTAPDGQTVNHETNFEITGGSRMKNFATNGEVRMFSGRESVIEPYYADLNGVRSTDLDVWRFLAGVVTRDRRRADAEFRALGIGSDIGAGYMVPTIFADQLIQASRAAGAALAAGVTLMKMDSINVDIAKVTGEPSASWTGESKALADGSNSMTFGRVSLHGRKAGVYIRVSLELIMSSPNLEQVIRDAFTAQMGLALDAGILWGSGAAEEPLGVKNCDDTVTKDFAGVGVNFDDLAAGYYSCLAANAKENDISLLYNSDSAEAIGNLKDGEGHYLETTNGGTPASWSKLHRYVSNNLKTASGKADMYMGPFQEIILGYLLEPPMQISVSTQASSSTASAFTQNETWLKILWIGDVAVSRPERFYVFQDAGV